MQKPSRRRVRFIRHYGAYAPGEIITPIRRLYDALVGRGIAVPVDEVETTMVDPAREQAVRPRGKPRQVAAQMFNR